MPRRNQGGAQVADVAPQAAYVVGRKLPGEQQDPEGAIGGSRAAPPEQGMGVQLREDPVLRAIVGWVPRPRNQGPEPLQMAPDPLAGLWLFVSVAERQSFSGAARTLGVSPQAVSQGISNLEERAHE